MTHGVLAQGPRLCLRDWRQDDLPLYEHWLQPVHKWQETDGPYYPQWSASEIQAKIARLQHGILAGDWPRPRTSAVISETADSPLIGMVNRYWENEPCRSAYLGVAVFPEDRWGQGLGTEAFGLWVDYLFSNWDVHRLGFATWSGNLGMLKVAQKLGFTQEARLRKARLVRGELYDGVSFGMLREEWEEQRPLGGGSVSGT